MAKNTKTSSRAASSITYDAAKEIVDSEHARRRQVALQQLQARATEIIQSPTTQKVGIAALGAGIGIGIYALATSA